MSSGRQPRSYAICYGFMEGAGSARKLRRLLSRAGFTQTGVTGAEIVIAHSAGCVLIPTTAQPKLVVYVGMPLVLARPQHTWIQTSLPTFNQNFGRELLVRLNNAYYVVRHFKRNLAIIRNPRIAQPRIFPKAHAIFIANRDDPWPKGAELDKLVANQSWTFISLPGTHDNLWQESQQYVDIIKCYEPRLLA